MSPYEIPDCAGRPYRPSNGTEGSMFQAEFCDRCKHDQLYQKTQNGEDGCKIILASLVNNVDDKDYPPEWTHDWAGRPICTAFEEDTEP